MIILKTSKRPPFDIPALDSSRSPPAVDIETNLAQIIFDALRQLIREEIHAALKRFDCNEPIHIHVRRERQTCKFWLEPIQLAANHGFAARELNIIRRLIEAHYNIITEAWHEHCG